MRNQTERGIAARRGGGRKQRSQLERSRVVLRGADLVVDEQSLDTSWKICQILRTGTPIACDHRRCRDKHGSSVGHWVLACNGVLIPEEEKQFVLDHRATHGSAELIALKRIASRREEIAGVHIAVAEE